MGAREADELALGDAALATPAAVTSEFVTPYYLRFVVRDRPGIIAAIASALGRHAINIDAVLQLPAAARPRCRSS